MLKIIVDRVSGAPEGEGSLRLTGYSQKTGKVNLKVSLDSNDICVSLAVLNCVSEVTSPLNLCSGADVWRHRSSLLHFYCPLLHSTWKLHLWRATGTLDIQHLCSLQCWLEKAFRMSVPIPY